MMLGISSVGIMGTCQIGFRDLEVHLCRSGEKATCSTAEVRISSPRLGPTLSLQQPHQLLEIGTRRARAMQPAGVALPSSASRERCIIATFWAHMATPGLILHLLLLASSSSQSLDTFIDQALINEQNNGVNILLSPAPEPIIDIAQASSEGLETIRIGSRKLLTAPLEAAHKARALSHVGHAACFNDCEKIVNGVTVTNDGICDDGGASSAY